MRHGLPALLAVILIAAAFKLTVRRAEWYLVAQGPVPVYSTQIASTDAGRMPDTFMAKRERLAITRCIDAKHYMIVQVRLAEGQAGFILDGDYVFVDATGQRIAECHA